MSDRVVWATCSANHGGDLMVVRHTYHIKGIKESTGNQKFHTGEISHFI